MFLFKFEVMVTLKKQQPSTVKIDRLELDSEYLERTVLLDIYAPNESIKDNDASLLLINDGQDLVTMQFEKVMDKLMSGSVIQPLLCVGIHCGANRKMEYGTAFSADYLGRGSKAGLYSKFVFDELLPCIRSFTGITSFKTKSFAGFSLGGLSALDIVWNHASEFEKVGVFSGSLWWRRKAYEDGYDDAKDRLMHLQIKLGQFAPWLRFYFQCGTLDETADRNNNGIIDSIDDVTDLIATLKEKGYSENAIHYSEMEDGKHDVATWAKAFPAFLQWGWGIEQHNS